MILVISRKDSYSELEAWVRRAGSEAGQRGVQALKHVQSEAFGYQARIRPVFERCRTGLTKNLKSCHLPIPLTYQKHFDRNLWSSILPQVGADLANPLRQHTKLVNLSPFVYFNFKFLFELSIFMLFSIVLRIVLC